MKRLEFKNSRAFKYVQERLCKGGDCTARSQMFLVDGAVQKAAEMFAKERSDELDKILNKKAKSILKIIKEKNL